MLQLCILALGLFQGEDCQDGPISYSKRSRFRAAFEASLATKETNKIHSLITNNSQYVVDLFKDYTEKSGEAALTEEEIGDRLGKAAALASAIQEAYGTDGLQLELAALRKGNPEIQKNLTEANSLYDEGERLFDRSDWEGALTKYSEAVPRFEKASRQSQLLATFERMGFCSFNLSRHDYAFDCFESGLRIATLFGTPDDIALFSNNAGFTLLQQNQAHGAVPYLNLAAVLAEKSGRFNVASIAHRNIAATLLATGALGEDAAAHARRAIELCKVAERDEELPAALSMLANCLLRTGDIEGTTTCFEKAIKLSKSLDQPRHQAFALMGLGFVYQQHLGQFEQAITRYEEALEIRRKSSASPQEIADSLWAIGNCYLFLGQFDKGAQFAVAGLELRRNIGAPRDLTHSLLSLGYLYERLESSREAEKYLEEALRIAREIGDPTTLVAALNALGRLRMKEGNTKEAQGLFLECLDLTRQDEVKLNYARALGDLAYCLQQQGKSSESIPMVKEALTIFETSGNRKEMAASLDLLAKAYDLVGDFEKAVATQIRAFEIAKEIESPLDNAMISLSLGKFFAKVGQLQASFEQFEGAAHQLSRVRRRRFSEEGRASFLRPWQELRQEIAKSTWILDKSGDRFAMERGFPLFESFFAQGLTEGLQEQTIDVISEQSHQAGVERVRLVEEIEGLRYQIAELAAVDQNEHLVELSRKVAEREKQLTRVESKIRLENPHLVSLLAPTPISLESARKDILSENDAILIFALGMEESYLWVVTLENCSIFPIAGVESIRSNWQKLSYSIEHEVEIEEPARNLYRLLIEPAETLLRTKTTLIIVPDSFLGRLPFEVLLTRDTTPKQDPAPYLVREKAVFYAPSLSFLIQSRKKQLANQSMRWTKDVLLIGDPIYENSSQHPEGTDLTSANPTPLLPRLPYSRNEVTQIALMLLEPQESKTSNELASLPRSATFRANRFDLFLGNEARVDIFSHGLSEYRVIHLAIHGLFRQELPWLSSLAFSPNKVGEPPRLLSPLELADKRINSEIVFLSACETAVGDVQGAEGIRNLVRSFLLAGVNSVIATQNKVHDDAASAFSYYFYKNLFEGNAPANALQKAKLQFLGVETASPRIAQLRGVGSLESISASPPSVRAWSHPKFWAPFVLWGR